MTNSVIEDLANGGSIVIVGPSDDGKTFWAVNTLIPKLESLGKTVEYAKDGNSTIGSADIAIFDEAETLADMDELQAKYSNEYPYYSEAYLQQVAHWHRLYAAHTEPSVYIISRREGDIPFLVEHFSAADWDGRKLNTICFHSS